MNSIVATIEDVPQGASSEEEVAARAKHIKEWTEQAGSHFNLFQEHAHTALKLIGEAYKNKDWNVLKLKNWDEYCTQVLGTDYMRVHPAVRMVWIEYLAELKMSQRAIGAAVGTDQSTVSRTLAALKPDNSNDGSPSDSNKPRANSGTRNTTPTDDASPITIYSGIKSIYDKMGEVNGTVSRLQAIPQDLNASGNRDELANQIMSIKTFAKSVSNYVEAIETSYLNP